MKSIVYLTLIFLSTSFCFSQVGINEDMPNDAAVLDINSQMTINFGGLKLPVVTDAQKALFPVTSSSDGVLVYVNYSTSSCLEIYDAISGQWQQIQCVSPGPTTLFMEDFESYVPDTGIDGNGNSGDYPAAVTQWTLTDVGNTLGSGDYVTTQSGLLEANDTNGMIQFDTQFINIAGYSNISFSVDISGTGNLEYNPAIHATDATNVINDYMDVAYSIDGGPFITITDYNGNGTVDHTLVPFYTSASSGTAPFFPDDTVVQSGLSGSTLVIRFTFQNWASDEFLYIDNIIVTGI